MSTEQEKFPTARQIGRIFVETVMGVAVEPIRRSNELQEKYGISQIITVLPLAIPLIYLAKINIPENYGDAAISMIAYWAIYGGASYLKRIKQTLDST